MQNFYEKLVCSKSVKNSGNNRMKVAKFQNKKLELL